MATNPFKFTMQPTAKPAPEKRYFGQPVSFYERPYLTAKPEKDFLYDYDGPRGGRLTDAAAIYDMMKRGEIQTSAEKFLDYFTSDIAGNHNQTLKWKVDSYRSASVFKFMGGASKKSGEWGPLRYRMDSSEYVDPKAETSRDKAFADYLAATNMELNIKDDREDLEQINKELSALKIAKNNKDNFEDFSKRSGFVRYKRAMAGLSVETPGSPGWFADLLARARAEGITRKITFPTPE